MIVTKFGGSSLADAGHVRKVLNIIKDNAERKVVVVSAPGKRHKSDHKVTDLLINCAMSRINGAGAPDANGQPDGLDALLERYRLLVVDLGLDIGEFTRIENDIYARLDKYESDGMSDDEFLDLMKAAGEDNCAKLIAAYFNSQGLPSKYINPKDAGFFMSESFGNAVILRESYDNLAGALGGVNETIVFPGFFGYTKSGKVITFSRGGSDVTGSILAAALDAALYENYTDVDSVFTVDPGLVANPLPLREITYREMRELSYGGFKVYHEDALVPVFHKGVPVYIKNTNNPSEPGTVIVKNRERQAGGSPVTGISSAGGFLCLHISKLLMNTEIGFGRKVLGIIEDENLPFEHMPSGIDNISIILNEALAVPDKMDRIMARLKHELHVDEVSVRGGLAIVMLVGEGMLHTVGTTARASRALAGANINIEIINQGSSEVSLMFGIDEKDADNAVVSLYNEFFPDGVSAPPDRNSI